MPRTMPNSGKVLSWSELDVNKRELRLSEHPGTLASQRE